MSAFEKKTILVTGATGLIGSHIVDYFMQNENTFVIALARCKEKLQMAFEKYLDSESSRFRIIAQDICEPLDSLDNTHIDFIFHAAGPMERDVIDNYPLSVISPNIAGLIHCLELLKRQTKKGVYGRLIVFSSVTVYANPTDENITVNEDETAYTERLNGRNTAYSQSKRMAEVIAQAYKKQYGLDVVIGRFSTVYGNTRFIPKTAFYEFVGNIIVGKDICLQNGCLPRRDNIFIDDAVRGALIVAEKGISGEVYNISSNGELDNFAAIDELAELIAREGNDLINDRKQKKVHVIYGETTCDKRQGGLLLDNKKLKALGWNLSVSLTEGIKRSILEMKEHENQKGVK